MRFSIAIFVMALCAEANFARADFNIRDHGARSDTQDVQTHAIQQTIDACASAGGGTVIIPSGTFITGEIRLRSHVTLMLQSGAVLKGSPHLEDYRIDDKLVGLISAIDAEDVGICGSGTIDGNGMAFMNPDTPHGGNDYDRKFVRQGEAYLNGKDAWDDGPILPKARPGNMVVFANCKKVRISNVTLHEPPYWTLHINGSEDVVIHGITVANRQDIPNNDGIHCSTSRDVHISDCTIITGDDAIAISGVNDHAGAVPGFIGYNKPAENVTIDNCTLRSRSAGVRIGYGFNDCRNIVASNLVIDANRGIGIFARDHGNISNLIFTNILIRTQLYRGHWWGKAEPIHISALPMNKDQPIGRVSDVQFHNIIADAEDGVVLYASEPGLIQNIQIDDMKLTLRGSPQQADYGGNLDLRPAFDPSLRLFKHDIAGVFAHGVNGLQLRNLQIGWSDSLPPFFSRAVECEDFSDLEIDDLRGTAADTSTETIALHHGRGATLRNIVSPSATAKMLWHEGVEDLRISPSE
jgi:polygalacturonase